MSDSRRLYDALLANDNASSNSLAFTFVDENLNAKSYSRSELIASVDKVASGLAPHVVANSIHAILTASQEQQVLQYLALLSLDAIPAILTPPNVKLEPSWYFKSMVAVLSEISPALVVTDLSHEIVAASAAGAPLPTLLAIDDGSVIARASNTSIEVEFPSAFVQFSSGTTGSKKGVSVTADAAIKHLDEYGAALGLTSTDVIANWLPLYHDMGFISSLHLPLRFGIHSVLQQPLDWVVRPSSWVQVASFYNATMTWQPNFALAFMGSRVKDQEVENCSLRSIRGVVNCSEAVTFEAQERFANRLRSIGFDSTAFRGCYAMAETTYAVTDSRDSLHIGLDAVGPMNAESLQTRLPLVSVGHALPSVEIDVVDDNHIGVVDGELGELRVSAPFLASGYVRNQLATSVAFIDGWYYTGDLGYKRDNNIYVLGRKKDVLIVAGNNVFPEDIEVIVGATPGVHGGRVVAFALFDEKLQTDKIVILAEPDDADNKLDFTLQRQQLSSALQLANFTIEQVEPAWLVKSSSGKISRTGSREKWVSKLS